MDAATPDRRAGIAADRDPYRVTADIAVFEVEDYREIPYYFGVNKCWMTLKKGEIVFRRA